jgi:hypothetical protein
MTLLITPPAARIVHNLGYLLMLSYGFLFSATLAYFGIYGSKLFWTIEHLRIGPDDDDDTGTLFLKIFYRFLAPFPALSGLLFCVISGWILMAGVFFVVPSLKPKWERFQEWAVRSYDRSIVFGGRHFGQDQSAVVDTK